MPTKAEKQQRIEDVLAAQEELNKEVESLDNQYRKAIEQYEIERIRIQGEYEKAWANQARLHAHLIWVRAMPLDGIPLAPVEPKPEPSTTELEKETPTQIAQLIDEYPQYH